MLSVNIRLRITIARLRCWFSRSIIVKTHANRRTHERSIKTATTLRMA